MQSEQKIVNAQITDTAISMADHGCLTFDLCVEGDGWGTVIGGYCIGKGYLGAKEFDGINKYGVEALMHIMDVVGVERWEDLTGKFIRCVVTGMCEPINTIGHLIDDKWFNLKEFFETKSTEKPDGRLTPLPAVDSVQATGLLDGFTCPRCGQHVRDAFCRNCGQAIDWQSEGPDGLAHLNHTREARE